MAYRNAFVNKQLKLLGRKGGAASPSVDGAPLSSISKGEYVWFPSWITTGNSTNVRTEGRGTRVKTNNAKRNTGTWIEEGIISSGMGVRKRIKIEGVLKRESCDGEMDEDSAKMLSVAATAALSQKNHIGEDSRPKQRGVSHASRRMSRASDIWSYPVHEPLFPRPYWALLSYVASYGAVHPAVMHKAVCEYDHDIRRFHIERRAFEDEGQHGNKEGTRNWLFYDKIRREVRAGKK